MNDQKPNKPKPPEIPDQKPKKRPRKRSKKQRQGAQAGQTRLYIPEKESDIGYDRAPFAPVAEIPNREPDRAPGPPALPQEFAPVLDAIKNLAEGITLIARNQDQLREEVNSRISALEQNQEQFGTMADRSGVGMLGLQGGEEFGRELQKRQEVMDVRRAEAMILAEPTDDLPVDTSGHIVTVGAVTAAERESRHRMAEQALLRGDRGF